MVFVVILGLLKFVEHSPIKLFKTCYYCPIIISLGTGVQDRQDSEQCSEPTKAETSSALLARNPSIGATNLGSAASTTSYTCSRGPGASLKAGLIIMGQSYHVLNCLIHKFWTNFRRPKMTTKPFSNGLKPLCILGRLGAQNVPQEGGFQGSQARPCSPQSVLTRALQSSNIGETLIIIPVMGLT